MNEWMKLKEMANILILGLIKVPNSGCKFFLIQKSDFVKTRYHGLLSSCRITEKTNGPILRKFSNRWTDRWTDESDLIGHCSTDVKCPITIKLLRKEFPMKAFAKHFAQNYLRLESDCLLGVEFARNISKINLCGKQA